MTPSLVRQPLPYDAYLREGDGLRYFTWQHSELLIAILSIAFTFGVDYERSLRPSILPLMAPHFLKCIFVILAYPTKQHFKLMGTYSFLIGSTVLSRQDRMVLVNA